MTKKSYKTR